MAFSKCGKCGGGFFEIQQNEPTKSAYKVFFVQCSSCGTPIGVTDYYNSGALLKKQEEAIEQLSGQVRNLSGKIDHVDHVLRQIAQHLNR